MNNTTIHRRSKAAHKAAIAQAKQAAQLHVERGTCPCCGTKLIRNNAITGWWQCGAYACESFRRPEFKGLPHCEFQCFTE